MLSANNTWGPTIWMSDLLIELKYNDTGREIELPSGFCQTWYDGCNFCEVTGGTIWHDLYMHCKQNECPFDLRGDRYCYRENYYETKD